MSKLEPNFKSVFFEKRTITKDEFADQVIELIEDEHSLALSPQAFEFAVGWMYKKYKLGLIESK